MVKAFRHQKKSKSQILINNKVRITLNIILNQVKQIKQQNLDVKEFLEIWNNILDQVDDEDGINVNYPILLTDEQIVNILEIIQNNLHSNMFKKISQLSQKRTQRFMELHLCLKQQSKLFQTFLKNIKDLEMFQKNFLILKSKENLSKKKLSKFIYQEQKKVKIILEENTYKQSEIQQDYEDQQDLKSLQIILEKLEVFDNQYIFDKKQIINISEDDLKIVIAALKMKIFTIYEFYQNFIEFYHEQQIQKLRQLGKVENVDSFTIDLLQFSESLAIEMTMNQATQVNYEQKGRLKLKNDYFDQNNEDDLKIQYFDDLEDNYRKLVRSSGKGKAIHLIINLYKNFMQPNIQIIQLINFNSLTINLLKKMQVIQKNQYLIRKNLISFQKITLGLREYQKKIQNLRMKITLNQFLLLNYLQRKHLRQLLQIVFVYQVICKCIQEKKTTFKGLSFYKSKLKKSIFNEVIIDSCLFDQANLEEAKWTNMIFSEKPLLQGHKGSVVVIQYSNNGKFIASGDSQKVIKFLDVATFQQEGEISDISGIPKYLVFSADDQLLFVGDDTNRIESWLISDLKNIIKLRYLINKQEKIIKMQLSSEQNLSSSLVKF
ncbi:unnamed protein product [Paramecium pentaurelia]|uniref:WD40-repeat-containing domain n=1 Tax=Paramecium pentaurelia TaxID=43138 RepID=A0A8S1XWF2_9CILI|nr:unnamed protein product [Paramecium pentaurelia]